MNELSPASFTRLQFRWSASYRALLKPPLTPTAPQSRIETVGERMFEQSRSLAGGIKGLRYAVLFFPDAGPRGSGTEDLPQRSPAGRPGWENDLRRSITARRCDARVTLSPESIIGVWNDRRHCAPAR